MGLFDGLKKRIVKNYLSVSDDELSCIKSCLSKTSCSDVDQFLKKTLGVADIDVHYPDLKALFSDLNTIGGVFDFTKLYVKTIQPKLASKIKDLEARIKDSDQAKDHFRNELVCIADSFHKVLSKGVISFNASTELVLINLLLKRGVYTWLDKGEADQSINGLINLGLVEYNGHKIGLSGFGRTICSDYSFTEPQYLFELSCLSNGFREFRDCMSNGHKPTMKFNSYTEMFKRAENYLSDSGFNIAKLKRSFNNMKKNFSLQNRTHDHVTAYNGNLAELDGIVNYLERIINNELSAVNSLLS